MLTILSTKMNDPRKEFDDDDKSSRSSRPVLRHSNNLHCGSFLEQLNAEDDDHEPEKENNTTTSGPGSSRRKLRRRSNSNRREEELLRHRFSTLQQNSGNTNGGGGCGVVAPGGGGEDTTTDVLVIRRILSEKEEWGKFHELLKRKRQRCSTHASIQQFINGLVQEQGRQMIQSEAEAEAEEEEERKEQEEDQEEDAGQSSSSSPRVDEEIRKQRLYGFYRNALISEARPVNDDDYSIEGQFVV